MPPFPPHPIRCLSIRRFARFVGSAALWLGLAAPLTAGALSWDTLAFDREAPLGAASEDFTFHFKNSGNAPVTIVHVQTSCGCTTAALAKQVYAPGEGGDLTVTYRFGGQVGSQEKTISVTTSDAPDQPTVLVLRVKIPEFYTVTPRLVWWSVGDAPEEKQTAIAINPALKAVIALEARDDAAFGVRLEARPGGHDYVLSIKPASTRTEQRTRVDLRLEPEGFAPQVVTVYALVR